MYLFKKNILFFVALLLLLGCTEENQPVFKNGDIIFQDSPSSQSQAIKLATKSNYSHVGIIYENEGKISVYEAVGPVVLTPLKKWISHGVDNHYVLKRLKNRDVLTQQVLINMKKVAKKFNNKPYDALFAWSDDRIYCSELVWKIYKRAVGIELGVLKKLGSFDLTHPVVKSKLDERYGQNIPLNEPVIAPQGIFDSDLLKTIYQN